MKRILIIISLIVLNVANSLAEKVNYDFSAVCSSGQTLYYKKPSNGKVSLTYPHPYGTSSGEPLHYYGYVEPSGNLVIPDTVIYGGNKYPVGEIWDAFAYCKYLTSVTIPNTVTNSGYFIDCRGLESVSISNSVTTIGSFSGCTNLKSITIPNSVTTIGSFSGCTNLKSIIIPNSVTTINGRAFYNCIGLSSSVTIPNSVTTIGADAFSYTNIKFFYCEAPSKPTDWHSMWAAGGEVIWGVKIVDNFVYKITSNSPRTVSLVSYLGNSSSVVIPSKVTIGISEYSVTDIADYTFYNSTLVSIELPNTIASIGNYTFYNCTNLTSINMPSSVTSIGNNAFYNCSNLQSLNIPTSVTSIGSNVLDLCNNLSYISISSSTPPTITQSTFTNFDASIPIYIPCGSLSNYTSTDYWNGLNFIEDFTYQFEVTSADESKGSVEIVTAPTCGGAAVIKAVSNTDYAFFGWSDGNIENPRTAFVSSDTTFTAIFVSDNLYVEIAASNSEQGSVNTSGSCHFNENITFSATANYGYHFASWSDGTTDNPRTIKLRQDTSILAYFDVNQYTVGVECNNAERGSVSGGGSFNYLSNNNITATPKYGYEFVRWSDNNTDNPRTIIVTRDTAFTAIFVPLGYLIEVKSADSSMGTVAGTTNVEYQQTAIISAAAIAAHHHFVQWNDGNRQNPRQVTVERDTLFVATFAIDTFSVAAKCDTAMGAVSGAGLYSYGSAAKVEAKPAAHHHFVQWKNGAAQTTQEFVVEHDTAFEAVFAIDRHTVALAASDSLCGAVSGAGSYDYGASVQLQATPAANCYFTGWSDGVTTNPRTLTVEGDTNIVAEFGKLQTVNIMVAANDTLRGTVAGTGSYVVGNNATLSATASAHYLFEQWSDGRTDNPRTVRIIADATYTAVFVPMQYNIILSQNNADMGMVSGSGVYSYGERVSCLAKPYPNYHFVQWSNGETANPYEFVVEEDKMLTAYFAAGAVTAIGNESAIEPTIYAIGKTIVVENATDEIRVYDAMGKLICRDVACRVRAELRVNAAGVYIVKTGNVVMRVVVE